VGRNVELLYADESGWKGHGKLLWPWVFTCATATLVIGGRRSRDSVRHVLGEAFGGRLMSDGYWASREIDWRLRRLAHLIRKAHGLQESLHPQSQRLGAHILPGYRDGNRGGLPSPRRRRSGVVCASRADAQRPA
jgi:hypothetical protein